MSLPAAPPLGADTQQESDKVKGRPKTLLGDVDIPPTLNSLAYSGTQPSGVPSPYDLYSIRCSKEAEISVPTSQQRTLNTARASASFETARQSSIQGPPRPEHSASWHRASTRTLLPRGEFLTAIAEAQRVAHLLDGIFILVCLAQKSLHLSLVA